VTEQRDRTVRGLDQPPERMTLARRTPPTTATRSSLQLRGKPEEDDRGEHLPTIRTVCIRGQTGRWLGAVIGTLEQPAPTTDTRVRRSAPAPRHPKLTAPLDSSALLTDLSATVSHILGLQEFHAGDAEVQYRLRRAVAELELLISHLLRTYEARSPADPQPPVSSPRQRVTEQAFLAWLAEPTSADQLPVTDGDRPEPLAQILGELSLSRRLLPSETAAGLGLPADASVGHAATEVLLAVKDPAGPRCRSFRAAVFYLRGLDRDYLSW